MMLGVISLLALLLCAGDAENCIDQDDSGGGGCNVRDGDEGKSRCQLHSPRC